MKKHDFLKLTFFLLQRDPRRQSESLLHCLSNKRKNMWKTTKFRENFKNPTKNHKFPVNAPSQLYDPFCSLLEPLKPVTVSNSSDNLTSQSTYSQWISKCVTTHYFFLFGRCCLSLAFHICQSSLLDLCELLIEDIQHAKVHWLRSEIFFSICRVLTGFMSKATHCLFEKYDRF